MIAVKEHLYTVEEFEQSFLSPENGTRLIELINGKVYEKMPTEEHGVIAGNILFELKKHIRQTKTGRAGVEIRHKIPQDDHNSRLPDVSYTRRRRPLVKKGSVPQMPDLAVEIKSPHDTMAKMRETAAYYLKNGADLVWLVYPDQEMIEVCRANGEIEILTVGDTLTGNGVVPGFKVPVAEVFLDA